MYFWSLKLLLFISALLFASFAAFAQDYTIEATKTNLKIELDGKLNEAVWQNSKKARDFYQCYPNDTSYACSRTEVMLTYDDKNLYVGAICYDTLRGDFIVTSLKRDWSYPINDAFVITLDPFNDKTNGFSFGVNPYGAQREGLIANSGMMGVSTDWDNKWYSEVSRDSGKWTVEMMIPFKSLRYKTNIESWGVNFSRNDLKRNENSNWHPVPRQFNISSLNYCGKLKWETELPKVKNNIALIPYGISSVSEDYIKKDGTKFGYNAGLDAKLVVGTSLNLDITVNPDFSQVEVDRQVSNLTRFSLFFPERRYFFIENSDLFARFGFSTIRPFFSRRIGLESGKIIPILGGLRLSGKINKNWRIGVMNMQSNKYEDASLKMNPQNFTVAAIQRQVNTKSSIAGIFVNKQDLIGGTFSNLNYNRIAGIDYNHVSKNNKVQGKTFLHYAFTDQKLNKNYAHAVWIDYNTRHVQANYNHEIVGENYIADVGFVPRLYNYDPVTNTTKRIGFVRYEDYIHFKFYPKSKIINQHGPGIYYNQYNTIKLQANDRNLAFNYQFIFQNQGTAKIEFQNLYTRLYFNTDITQTGSKTLVNAGQYYYKNLTLNYTSTKIKKLNGLIGGEIGEFYIGKKVSLNTELNYRLQPYGNFSITYTRDQIIMPTGYKSAVLNLVGPRAELAFTKNIFWTTFLQYNTQINNFNINSRFQWRFKPMCDLFVVYSDNYDTQFLNKKNRAIVVKFVYWISV